GRRTRAARVRRRHIRMSVPARPSAPVAKRVVITASEPHLSRAEGRAARRTGKGADAAASAPWDRSMSVGLLLRCGLLGRGLLLSRLFSHGLLRRRLLRGSLLGGLLGGGLLSGGLLSGGRLLGIRLLGL